MIGLVSAMVSTVILFAGVVSADWSWTPSRAVPGLNSLSSGGAANVWQISCAQQGWCAAVGSYTDNAGGVQGFVADEAAGVWRQARDIPGLRELNGGKIVDWMYISCPSAGSCTLAGTYKDAAMDNLVFVASETKGVWGHARDLPGFAELNSDRRQGMLQELSCWGVGDCIAGGFYDSAASRQRAFVATEINGTWGRAQAPPGISRLKGLGVDDVNGITCLAGGYCAVIGNYIATKGFVVFTDSVRNGVWASPQSLPGIAPLTRGGSAYLSVACASPGNCVAGGSYEDNVAAWDTPQALVAVETRGRWKAAQTLRGVAMPNPKRAASIDGVACTKDGSCVAVGDFTTASGRPQGFEVEESRGKWGTSVVVPGVVALDGGWSSSLSRVACSSPGNCVATGEYSTSQVYQQAMVVVESKGRWGRAHSLAGSATLNEGGWAELPYVSCSADGACGVAGTYKSANNATLVMVASARISAG